MGDHTAVWQPGRTARLYETFLAGCYEKAEEVDDSGGDLGMFVEGLYCGWIKARQGAKPRRRRDRKAPA